MRSEPGPLRWTRALGDAVPEAAEAQSRAAYLLESAVEGLSGAVRWSGAVEEREHVVGAMVQGPPAWVRLALLAGKGIGNKNVPNSLSIVNPAPHPS